MSAERDDAEICEELREQLSEQLREHYQRLRSEDERLGRTLDAYLPAAGRQPLPHRAASRRQRPRPGLRLAAALALALALLAGVGALLWPRPRPAPPPEAAVYARLWAWRAPTDSLLRSPGTPGELLLRGVPRLGESRIGGDFDHSFNGNDHGGNARP